MNIVAAILADSLDSPSGLPSRVHEDIGGEPMIRRLVRKVVSVKDLSKVVVITRRENEKRMIAELQGLPCRIKAVSWQDIEQRDALRRARKWAWANWRGGLMDTFTYDEEGPMPYLWEVFQEEQADRVIKMSGHTPFCDTRLLATMIENERLQSPDLQFYVPQLPPGFAYEFYWGNTLRNMAAASFGARNVLRYDPSFNKNDAVTLPVLFTVEEQLLLHPMRMLADSARGLERVRGLHREFGDAVWDWTIHDFLKAYHARRDLFWGRAPKEIELEITTRQAIWSRVRPRPRRAAEARDMSFDEFKRVIDSAAAVYDDILLTLGGWGDPLLHPEWRRFVEYARAAGIHGLHVATHASALTPDDARALVDLNVDAISFVCDAASDEQYRMLTGGDGLEAMCRRFLPLHEHRQTQRKFHPFLVADFVKSKTTFAEMEGFFDRFFFETRVDVVIRGFNDYSGQAPDDAMAHLTLSKRRLCDSLQNRMVILSDGRVPACGQDFEGLHPIGNAFTDTIESLWRHPRMDAMRQGQMSGDFASGPLCAACKDWDHP